MRSSIFFLLLLAGIMGGASLTVPYYRPAGFFIWRFIVVGGGIPIFTRWKVRNTAYECLRCHNVFSVSLITEFWGPIFLEKTLLPCPKCQEETMCCTMGREAISGEVGRAEAPSSRQTAITCLIVLCLLLIAVIRIYVELR